MDIPAASHTWTYLRKIGAMPHHTYPLESQQGSADMKIGMNHLSDGLAALSQNNAVTPPRQTEFRRRWAEAAPEKMERLYQDAISGAGAVPYSYDFVSKSYVFMGAGIEELIGYKPEEVTPALWTEIVKESVMLGQTAGMSKDEAGRRAREGEVSHWRCDMRVITKTGISRWISDASVQNVNAEGRPIGSVGILQDITERKQAELSAVAFSRLGQELFSASTLEGSAQIIARVADDLFRWDACNLYLYVAEADEIFPIYEADIIDGHRKIITPKARQKPSANTRRILDHGAELLLKQGMDPTSTPYGDKQRPSASIMRVPLRVKGKPTGILAIHSYTQNAYTQKDLNILQTLADYCSGAFERIWAEENVRTLHRQLVETSRMAGMAEVGTSVLHNVGNVLNSVNISTSLISEKIRKSKVPNLGKAIALMQEHQKNLPAFLTGDARGRELPAYLASLSTRLTEEQEQILQEVNLLASYIDHIKEIVAMQQNYARVSGLTESLDAIDLVEDALRLNEGAIARHQVKVIREYKGPVPVTVDKHKVLQILVNLIRNAKYALDDGNPPEKLMTVRITADDLRVRISIIDNGVGIPAENLVKIFGHGFTTRKQGHGFGLHSGALTAKELGGSLTVKSEGWGKGAAFTLEFPRQPAANN